VKRKSVLVGSFLCMVAAVPTLGQAVISNGTFDANIAGWILNPDIPTSGYIEWTAIQGQPPGALRFVGEDAGAFTTDCFTFETGLLAFSADAFMETSGEFVFCHLNYLLYSTSDCSDEPATFVVVGGVIPVPYTHSANTWERLTFELPVPPDPFNSTGFMTYRPILHKAEDFAGDDACVFDNVSLTLGPLPAPPIPVADSVGLGLLAALLALVGLTVLRRLR